MKLNTGKTGSVTEFEKLIFDVVHTAHVQSLFIFSCDSNGFQANEIDPILRTIPVPVFGGIFPAIMCGNEKTDKGTVVIGLEFAPHVTIIPSLSNPSMDYDQIIEELLPEQSDTRTMIILVDGLAKRISKLIEGMFNNCGLEYNYIGGGAGSLNFTQKPCLFTNQGMLADCALIVQCPIISSIGVQHGWRTVSGPYKVTDSDQNIIKTINWLPAFDVYKDVIAAHSNLEIRPDNFFDISKCYPFGISRFGAEKIVRDPIMTSENGFIVCVGEVPTESYVDILTSDAPALINAARNAYTSALQEINSYPFNTFTLFIDCISRSLFLEKQFQAELDAVYHESTPLIGALTIGEIANTGKEYLEFYNKTAVVGVLEDA
ncbi:FIST C-terminal domain-containing protein [candidate division KSB1 bacterium]|nr:FIST C-terminal domain-containing protein [candidate division KSB1 bacterium]